MKSLLRDRSRAAAETTSPTAPHFPFSTTRMSILPSVRIPLLRRSENTEAPHNSKQPLLTMRLSSYSFLDSSIVEMGSQRPLYTIDTSNTSSTITRNDRKRGAIKTAHITWPRVLPTKPSGKDTTDGVLVQMRDSRWDPGDSFLKPAASLNGSRKFKIPNYSQSMKWERYGDVYWCTTASVKGPIAVMDRAGRSEPTKLMIYETLYDKYDPKSLSAIKGVSVLLLDYIIVTALLLVTDLQEWMLVKRFEEPTPSIPGSSSQPSNSVPELASTQLRKIIYGEPIFPKLLATDSRSKHSSSSTGPMTPGPPQTPTSATFGSSAIKYEESFYTSSRPSSPMPGLPSIAGSRDDVDNCESFVIPEIQASTPLAESLRFSSRHPSHSHFDPSFYGSSEEPPVPSLPFKYSKSLRSLGNTSQPSTPLSQSFRREPFETPSSDRSEHHIPSPPEESIISAGSSQVPTTPAVRSPGMVRSERSNSVRSYSSSIGRRPLPKPPQMAPMPPKPPVPRRVQSSMQLRNNATSSPSPPPATAQPARPQRALPATPINSPSTSDTTSPPATSESSTAGATLLSPLSSEHAYGRNPPITKASQEDLTRWVHLLTAPQRDLPPAPLPSTSIYDVPPPAYDTINFSRSRTQREETARRTDTPS
ncbi:hypothetical protein HYPSUDRAFT_34709 [Hypholoma sublateritium FD-334 SS-4]|uniref:Uncharacterized protein n=1 Tax=Hypholoma sublateritium (strain FD-334 SS-4) TaxID=945553 RepID=A0A0D2MUD2_HYPSF|nr:hypothetical protein HYPSUDRAFT_34709 [Hypholoma sublateritium FD-334 SS-4]